MRFLTIVTLFFLPFSAVAQEYCVPTPQQKCIEPAETRIIEGQEIYKECWKYQVEYICHQQQYLDYCLGFSSIAGCNLLSTNCLRIDNDNLCEEYASLYSCSAGKNKSLLTIDYEHTITQNTDLPACTMSTKTAWCSFIGKRCLDQYCQTNRDDYVCVDSIHLNDCQDLDLRTCQLVESNCMGSSCQNKQFTYKCPNYSTEACRQQMQCLNGECFNLQPDTGDAEFSKSIAMLEGLNQAATDFNSDNLNIMSGKGLHCDKKKFGFQNCCSGGGGWGSSLGYDCSENEKLLGQKSSRGMCHYLGEYCNEREKITKACLSNRHVYCCFESKLSRIIHEGGRLQLGLNWGNVENPNCRGLTVEELQRIDFNRLDFTEIYEELSNQVKDADFKNKIKDTIQKNYAQ